MIGADGSRQPIEEAKTFVVVGPDGRVQTPYVDGETREVEAWMVDPWGGELAFIEIATKSGTVITIKHPRAH